MDMPILQAVQVSRVLKTAAGERPLLENISFQLERGQIMAIAGPSGAGKSTLLRLLNRMDEPARGQIFLDGEDYRQLLPGELRRRVGMVMQRPYLFPGSVASNVRFGPAQHGVNLTSEQVQALLQQVGLAGYEERDTANLSGGEAQRVSIARTLANEPEVLLLDEPTSALDPKAKQGVEELLKRLVRERRVACMWVTHDIEQARRVADLILQIEAGRMTGLSTSKELFHA